MKHALTLVVSADYQQSNLSYCYSIGDVQHNLVRHSLEVSHDVFGVIDHAPR